MTTLHEMLRTRREEVLQDWTRRIRGSHTARSLRQTEIEDHIPVFLEELAVTLEHRAASSSGPPVPPTSPPAAEHGLQRLRLGFDLGSLVLEYGALHDSIRAVAEREGVAIDARAADAIVKSIVVGISEAVTEYARQRDAELQRHATEHLAFVAHELRNPLGSARTAVSLLPRPLGEPADRLIQVIARGLQRLHDLIEHELELSRLVAKVPLHPERVSLGRLVDDIVGDSTPGADAKSVELRTDLGPGLEFDGDPRLLHSALGNLIGNAIKFSRPGGVVEIRGRRAAGKIEVEVEDSCGGLPPGRIEAAFTPFVQLGADRSGFGLGLAIARQAAEAHGGRIRVQDLPGRGCIFVLELPVPEATP